MANTDFIERKPLSFSNGVFQFVPDMEADDLALLMMLRAENLRAVLSAAVEPDAKPSREYLFACLAMADELKALAFALANGTAD
jgi:hypothetical protein